MPSVVAEVNVAPWGLTIARLFTIQHCISFTMKTTLLLICFFALPQVVQASWLADFVAAIVGFLCSFGFSSTQCDNRGNAKPTAPPTGVPTTANPTNRPTASPSTTAPITSAPTTIGPTKYPAVAPQAPPVMPPSSQTGCLEAPVVDSSCLSSFCGDRCFEEKLFPGNEEIPTDVYIRGDTQDNSSAVVFYTTPQNSLVNLICEQQDSGLKPTRIIFGSEIHTILYNEDETEVTGLECTNGGCLTSLGLGADTGAQILDDDDEDDEQRKTRRAQAESCANLSKTCRELAKPWCSKLNQITKLFGVHACLTAISACEAIQFFAGVGPIYCCIVASRGCIDPKGCSAKCAEYASECSGIQSAQFPYCCVGDCCGSGLCGQPHFGCCPAGQRCGFDVRDPTGSSIVCCPLDEWTDGGWSSDVCYKYRT